MDKSKVPGKYLEELFIEKFSIKENAFSDIDRVILSDGEFLHHMYMSSIYYLIRRYISTLKFYLKNYPVDEFGPTIYIEKYTSFLKAKTKFTDTEIDKIVTYADESLKHKRNQKKGLIKSILKQGEDQGDARCYICGKELLFGQDDIYAPEVEHVWPLSLGGNNEENNLVLACRKCNNVKENYINSSDFHFEEISLKNLESDSSFEVSFKWKYRIAVWAKSDYKCDRCGKPATQGELEFKRREPDDSWHFLNIDSYCQEHK